ncbi:MAG: DUF4423 domain-containing protein [Bdellovibrionota bacterium]
MAQAKTNVYAFTDYKSAIKETLREIRKVKASITMKSVATRMSIQPTYFSRVLNDENSHLSEDQLFTLAQIMKLLPEELDYLMLLRSHATTQDDKRRDTLFKKIESLRKSRLAGTEEKQWDPQGFHDEVAYLFSPLSAIVRVALFIKEYRKNPRALCSPLGISQGKLKEVLLTLQASEFVELADDDPFEIVDVKQRFPHFGREHPLMRAHQVMAKTALLSRLGQTAEADKESFFATFTMNEKGFEEVREEVKTFISRLQKIASSSKHASVYQLSLDFLKYL